MKKIIGLLLIIFMFTLFIGCDEKELRKLEIQGDTTVEVGKSITLTPIISGVDAPDYYWVLSDDNLASIENGVLTALKPGKVTVALNENTYGLQALIEITITGSDTLTKNLSIIGAKTVKVDETTTLTATYDKGSIVDLVWSSDNENIATVSNGVVTGVSKGNVTITVKDNKSNLTCTYVLEVKNSVLTIDDMLDWAFEQSGTEALDEVDLPEVNEEIGATFVWSTERPDLLDIDSKYVELVEVDHVIKLTCEATYNGEKKSRTIDFTVLGYAAYDVYNEFMKQFRGNIIYRDMTDLETAYSMFGGSTVELDSHNKDVFDNNGKLTKAFYDTKVNVTLHIRLTNPSFKKDFEVELVAKAMDSDERKALVKEWVEKNVFPDGYIYKNTVLPTFIDDYSTSLTWLNSSGGEFKQEFAVDNPILGDSVGLLVKIECMDGSKFNFELSCRAAITQITDPWEKIDLFVKTISESDVTAFSYLLINWTGYSTGYVPFITSDPLEIIEDILPYTDGNSRTGIRKTSTEYVVVHDTGSPSAGADATMHNNYIKRLNANTDPNDPNDRVVSWHFTIDDKLCYQHLPLDEVAWHAGDGSHRYGDIYTNSTYKKTDCIGGGNYNGIGIESCVHNGTDYTYTMRRLAKLVAGLLVKYNLGIDRVKQHWHFSGKNCPQVMRENNRWNELIYLIKLEYFMMTELKGATFEWTSLTPDILDNEGRIIGKQAFGTTVSYKVKVTYNGTSKEYTFSSVLKSR